MGYTAVLCHGQNGAKSGDFQLADGQPSAWGPGLALLGQERPMPGLGVFACSTSRAETGHHYVWLISSTITWKGYVMSGG